MADDDARAAPPPEEAIAYASPAGRWIMFVTILGSAIGFLDGTVVNVALPDLSRDLDADVAAVQWILNGYLLSLSALILLGGSLGDRYGRRRIFVIGTIWFTAASALCAAAPTAEILIVARILQGVGAALITPGSLAIIEASLRREDRSRAIGTWSALGGIAAAVGPLLGGYLIETVSWRAIFLINLPLGVILVLAAVRHVPETRDPTVTGKLDFAGSVLAAIGLAGTTYALVEAPGRGMSDPIVLATLAVGVVALAAFVLVERRAAQPMLPIEIFASRQFTAANLVTFTVYAALGGVFFLLVVVLQTSLGFSPVAAGAASLPITVLMLLLSSRAGALAQRIGPRLPLTFGPLLLAAGMLLLSRIGPGDDYLTGVLPGIVVFGLGLSATVAPVTATALAAADDRHAGVASGINNAVSRIAQLVAVAVLPIVAGLSGADFQDPDALADGFATAMLVAAGVAVLGAVLAWTTISDDLLEPGDEPPAARVTRPPSHCAVAGAPLQPGREPALSPQGR